MDEINETDALWDDPEQGLFDEPMTQEGPGLFDTPGAPEAEVEPAAMASDDPASMPGSTDSPSVAAPEPASAAAPDVAGGSTKASPFSTAAPDPASVTLTEVPAASEPATELAPPPAAERPERPTGETAAPLALYRRYRPDTFDEVIGQEHVTEPLRRALVNNKVNHAYLFSGPRGCGKTTSARILARSLNCEQGPTPTPCGQCQSCRDLARGGPGSIDVIELDAASNGGVEDARDLRERAFFAPVQSRYKIYIVDEAHMVTQAGFNALLKLVEEPPPHVKFIFATTEPEKVIGTIRSRTHHYPFRLVPPKVLVNYLATLCEAEGVAVETEVLPLVVRAGAGSVRDSLSVLDQLLGSSGEQGVEYRMAAALLGHTPETLLDEIVDAFAAGDGRGVFATIDKVIEVGQDPRRFAEDLLTRLRDLVIVAAVPEAVSSGLIDASGDQAERLSLQAAAMGGGELTRAAEVIATGLTEMRGTTAPRLHLELMCSRVLLPGADVDERGVHARLDRLERRLAEGGVPVSHDAPPPPPPTREGWSDTQRPGTGEPAGDGGTEPPRGDATETAPASVTEPTPASAAGPEVVRAEGPGQGQSVARGLQGARPNDAGSGARQRRPAEPPSPESGQARSQRPDGLRQRPHVEPTPITEQSVAPARRDNAAPRQSDAPSGGAQSRPGDIDTTRMRNEWARVLDEVRNRRRFTWILLSQNAQVHDVSEGALTLAFANVGARESFTSSGSPDILRDSIVEVLGADLRVVSVVDEGRSSQGGRGRGSSPSHDSPPRPPDEEPDPAPSEAPDHSSYTAAARASVRPTTTRRAEPGHENQVDAGESRDDEVLDDTGEDAAELVRRELGGQMIEEQPR